MLSQRPKYGLDIPDLKSARSLLHSIFRRATNPTPAETALNAEAQPFTKSHLDDALLLAALYPRFKLGDVSSDPISATLMISMFARAEGSTDGGESLKAVAQNVAADSAAKLNQGQEGPSAGTVPNRQSVWRMTELKRKKVNSMLSGLDSTNEHAGAPVTQSGTL